MLFPLLFKQYDTIISTHITPNCHKVNFFNPYFTGLRCLSPDHDSCPTSAVHHETMYLFQHFMFAFGCMHDYLHE